MLKPYNIGFILLGLFVILHSLFPPRVSKSSETDKKSRAFIFSENFNKTDLNYYELSEEDKKRGQSQVYSYNPAIIDWNRYTITLICGIGLFFICIGFTNFKQAHMKHDT